MKLLHDSLKKRGQKISATTNYNYIIVYNIDKFFWMCVRDCWGVIGVERHVPSEGKERRGVYFWC